MFLFGLINFKFCNHEFSVFKPSPDSMSTVYTKGFLVMFGSKKKKYDFKARYHVMWQAKRVFIKCKMRG